MPKSTRESIGAHNPYGNCQYARLHEQFRAPPRHALTTYLSIGLSGLRQPKTVLDIGAGTGHFSLPIARSFPNALVIALEPSAEMAALLRSKIEIEKLENLSISNLTLESYRPSRKFDTLVLSEVVHLFEDLRLLAERLSGLLQPGGTVLFRTSSQEQLFNRGWYRHFPTARQIDIARHPKLELLRSELEQLGINCTTTEIDESRIVTSEWYLKLLRERAYSTLYFVDDIEFSEGLREAEAQARGCEKVYFDYRMTLLLGIAND